MRVPRPHEGELAEIGLHVPLQRRQLRRLLRLLHHHASPPPPVDGDVTSKRFDLRPDAPSATLTRVVLGRLCPPAELFPDDSALETSPPLPREGT